MVEESGAQDWKRGDTREEGVNTREVLCPILINHRAESWRIPKSAPPSHDALHRLTLLHNRLDMPRHHLLQHDPQNAPLQRRPQHRVAPLSLLLEPLINLAQVRRRFELGCQTDSFVVVVFAGGGEEGSNEDGRVGLRGEGLEEADEGAEERSGDHVAVPVELAGEREELEKGRRAGLPFSVDDGDEAAGDSRRDLLVLDHGMAEDVESKIPKSTSSLAPLPLCSSSTDSPNREQPSRLQHERPIQVQEDGSDQEHLLQ